MCTRADLQQMISDGTSTESARSVRLASSSAHRLQASGTGP